MVVDDAASRITAKVIPTSILKFAVLFRQSLGIEIYLCFEQILDKLTKKTIQKIRNVKDLNLKLLHLI